MALQTILMLIHVFWCSTWCHVFLTHRGLLEMDEDLLHGQIRMLHNISKSTHNSCLSWGLKIHLYFPPDNKKKLWKLVITSHQDQVYVPDILLFPPSSLSCLISYINHDIQQHKTALVQMTQSWQTHKLMSSQERCVASWSALKRHY